MASDEVIWHLIGPKFCSYRFDTDKRKFCKNPYNVSGLCNRVSCPLANSQYGTIIESKGVCYLYLKTVERCHLPKHAWEKIRLSKSYTKALEQIELNMRNIYTNLQINRCKQRLTRIRQALVRMRKLELQANPKLITIKKKTQKRDANREKKSEIAAKLEMSIESELLKRLQSGTYGELYQQNEETEIQRKELTVEEAEEEGEINFCEGESDDEIDYMDENVDSDIEDLDEDDSDIENDLESDAAEPIEKNQFSKKFVSRGGQRRAPSKRVEIEYSYETEKTC